MSNDEVRGSGFKSTVSVNEFDIIGILNYIRSAKTNLSRGEYALAMENITSGWEIMPTSMKEKFERPRITINRRLADIPSEQALRKNRDWMRSHPGQRDTQKFRMQLTAKIVYEEVEGYADKFTRAIDTAGLLIEQRPGKYSKKNIPALSGGKEENVTTSD